MPGPITTTGPIWVMAPFPATGAALAGAAADTGVATEPGAATSGYAEVPPPSGTHPLLHLHTQTTLSYDALCRFIARTYRVTLSSVQADIKKILGLNETAQLVDHNPKFFTIATPRLHVAFKITRVQDYKYSHIYHGHMNVYRSYPLAPSQTPPPSGPVQRTWRGLVQRVHSRFGLVDLEERWLLSPMVGSDSWKVIETPTQIVAISQEGRSKSTTFTISVDSEGGVVVHHDKIVRTIHATRVQLPVFEARPPREVPLEHIPRFPPPSDPEAATPPEGAPVVHPWISGFEATQYVAQAMKANHLQLWQQLGEKMRVNTLQFRILTLDKDGANFETSSQQTVRITWVMGNAGRMRFSIHVTQHQPPAERKHPNYPKRRSMQDNRHAIQSRGAAYLKAVERKRARKATAIGFQRPLNRDGLPWTAPSVNEPTRVRPPEARRQVDVYGHEVKK